MMMKKVITNVLLGLCVAASLLLAAGTLWRESERQYLEATNLGLRLGVLRQSIIERGQFSQKYWPSWAIAWRPMVMAMQFEARHATTGKKGLHLSQPMYEQLARFAAEKISDETDLKKLLSQLDLSEQAFAATAPLLFSENERQDSLATVAAFRAGIASILSSETAYSAWLSPILYQQQDLDRATTCKTLTEIRAFQTYLERLQTKCADATRKWAACRGEDEPVTRQMKELQMTLESNLKKFQSRWSVENVNDLCAGL